MIESLKALDLASFLLINSLHHNSLNHFMEFLSGQIMWIPIIIYLIWLCKKQFSTNDMWLFLLFVVMAIIASDVTASYLIKNIVQRLRPCRDLEIKPLVYYFGQRCGGKFGFVSSHAANTIAIIVFATRTLNFKRYQHLLWLLPIAVCYSRIYLGVHYPGDILGGITVGIFWGLLLASLFNNRIKGPSELAPNSFS